MLQIGNIVQLSNARVDTLRAFRMHYKRQNARKFDRRRFKKELHRSAEEYFIDIEIEKEDIDNFDAEDFIEGYYDPYDPFEKEENEIYERDMETDEYRFRHRLGEYEGWDDHDDVWEY